MKKILVWETSSSVAGGQKVTLTVMELLKNEYSFCCLIPQEGALSEALKKLDIPYILMGDQTLPSGVKGKQVYFRYAWMSLKSIVKSLSAIRKFRPDILYAPGPASLPWSAICGTLSRRPVVWHLHHIFLDGATVKLLNLLSRCKAVRQIVSVSEFVGKQVTHPKGREKLRVLYNPVDFEYYAQADALQVKDEVEQAFGTKENRDVLLTQVALIRKGKYQETTVSIMEALKRKGIRAKCMLVGDAITEEDRVFKEELLNRIRESGLQQDIYLAGHRKNVQDYMAASDFVLVPSAVEGMSLVALEAMAVGKDVITADGGGVAELFRVANCGTMYPQDASADEIADIIIEAMKTDPTPRVERASAYCYSLRHEAYREKLLKLFCEQ